MKYRRSKKKIETKYLIIFIVLSVGVMIGLISMIIKDDRQLSFVEKGIKDVGLGIQRILYTPFRFVTGKIDNYNDMKRIYQKYKTVDEKESKALLYEKENQELKKNIAELQQLLDLKTILTNYKTINATVINRNIGTWYNTMTIDKGEKSGVKSNMIVIVSAGLIGKVITTTFYTSEIKLITTPDLNIKISVAISSTDHTTYGLLSGYDKISGEIRVIDIIDSTNIKVGDEVTTSGLSDSFPKGIVIGRVSKIEKDEFGISSIIRITPAADFNNIKYVTILGSVD